MKVKTNIVDTARLFAIRNHAIAGNSYDNQGYIVHLQMVANTAEFFAYELDQSISVVEVIAAAWSHDLIEDTSLSYTDVRKVIGTFAADIVYDVTNELGKNRKEKAQKTYPKIAKNPLAVFIKMADRISNATYSKEHDNTSMYLMYQKEYPSFRRDIKQNDMYPDMWEHLDKLNEYEAN